MEAERFEILMRLVDTGDEAAFEEIYNEYAKKIKIVALSVLLDEQYAEDVLQNVMIDIWNKSKKIRRIQFPDALIAKVAKNAAIDAYRKYKRRKHVSLDKLSDGKNFHLHSETTYFEVEFMSLIASLDDVNKDIVIKKVVFGLTFDNISEEMGIPVSTVKWRYKTSLGKIKNKNFL